MLHNVCVGKALPIVESQPYRFAQIHLIHLSHFYLLQRSCFSQEVCSRMALQLEDAVWSSILTTEVLHEMTNLSQLHGCCPSADPDLWPQVSHQDQLIRGIKNTLYFKNSKCSICIKCMYDALTEQKAKYINILNKIVILLMKN